MILPEYTRYTLRLDGVAARLSAPAVAQELDYTSPEAVALIGGLQPAGWQEEEDGRTLTFWLEEGAGSSPRAAASLAKLGSLGRLEVARERPGWHEAWRRFHRPRVVGKLYVRPPWYPPRDDLLDVAIEAGMAFGTGGHASTHQCLEAIQEIGPGSLLDLGSGSGVVALAALRLGFAPVWGVDIDPVAVHAAAGNAALNGLSPTFMVGDATDPGCSLPEAETVVANIALGPILRLSERFAPAGREAGGGRPLGRRPLNLVLAGLLVGQREEALAAYPAYEVVGQRHDGTWLMLHLARPA